MIKIYSRNNGLAFLLAASSLVCGACSSPEGGESSAGEQQAGPVIPEVRLIPVYEMVNDGVAQRPNVTDISFPLEQGASAGLHIHILAPDQMTPMHIHDAATEVTLILTGSPTINFAYGESGEVVHESVEAAQNALLLIPPGSGHEWENKGPGFQANLVYSRPKFLGNRYVRRSDPRLAAGVRLQQYSASELAGDEPGLTPIGDSGVYAVSIGESWELPDRESIAYFFLTQGEAQISTQTQQAAIGPGHLVVIPAGVGLSMAAQNSQALGYLFQL